ncbi:NAD(P)(+) transhydrogenase (Re/Si-specific) subunit beta [Chitinophaga qingshengii]|uniref:NAD(P) transhydrogenase subunit beta n=1 Tax=Chitinophaga qingshengii TaxID=1569794 RepID=A0ABR7TQZ6_9BACT|nr:NAD(P)(+) transhydrogenase (Re/Si-specific) subunit beta [Chitinophaga qingshengii]MBC9932415.1 NAD(P)(+) transhydrogenase (Re/Si-specific) subunit beta [Chitinophaga qingshengii]
MGLSVLSIIYLIGSVTFILGLKMLSKPDTARKGNLVAAAGMVLAILGTIFLYKSEGKHLHNYGWIAAGLLIGTVIGVMAAKKVKMTAMPEMVSMFNGMGGACAALISVVEFNHLVHSRFNVGEVLSSAGEQMVQQLQRILQGVADGNGNVTIGMHPDLRGHLLIILLGLIIGAVSFAGSVVAWGKLNGRIKDFAFKGQHIVNLVVMAIVVIGAAVLVLTVNQRVQAAVDAGSVDGLLSFQLLFYLILICALIYGILFVLPIGGADMPVVISLLNSFTGVAAACGGFLYNNPVMLTGGILVGSAGTILTILMCKAMNRSLKNVLIGSFGGGAAAAATSKEQGSYKEISLSDAAVVMAYANKVMIVPGYGLAVAQAQHACHELEKLLEDKGVEVKYAIHPVAGRMPGHMNVLLAEADVPYEKLLEMEDANAEMSTTDAVLVLGANDVVNPAAKNDPASPIYGMPILEVENAKLVIVNKRSMKPGYAGIENELFFQPKTSMLFGDAKQVLQQLVAEIKQV